MGYFKDLEIEIREMDFKGISPQKIADTVGLSIKQVIDLLESECDEDLIEYYSNLEYANNAADLDAEFYGNI